MIGRSPDSCFLSYFFYHFYVMLFVLALSPILIRLHVFFVAIKRYRSEQIVNQTRDVEDEDWELPPELERIIAQED